MYDRQTLLDVKNIAKEQPNHLQSSTQFVPSLMAIPDYLYHSPCLCRGGSAVGDGEDGRFLSKV